MHIYFDSAVFNTLFHSTFDVVRSAIFAVVSPEYFIKLPLAVNLTRFGSAFYSL